MAARLWVPIARLGTVGRRRNGELYFAPKTVEANIHRVLQKLDISETPDSNRRVLAVLTFLRSA